MSVSQYPQYTIPHELVHLGVGQPNISMLPLQGVREAAAHRLAFDDPLLLQYGDIPGYANLRKTLAQFLNNQAEYSTPIDPETLFVTNGITGALTLICTFYTSTGDIVYAEEPSYFLALNTFKDFRLKVDVIKTDANGLDVDALEEKLKNTPTHLRPKFIYTIPAYNNPCGVTLSHDRRLKLVALSEQYNFLVVADEVYQLLGFGNNKPLQHMYSYDKKGTVMSLGSFSKILAPGLRLGWIQASPSLLQKFTKSGQLDSGGALNPVISAIVHSAIELGIQQSHLVSIRKTLKEGCDTLCRQLREVLPSYVEWTQPHGGYFIWLKFPENWDGEGLLALAREKHKVAFQPGIRFSAVGGARNCIRLSFSYYFADRLEDGAKRLGAAIKEYATVVANAPPTPVEPAKPAALRVAVHGATGKLGSLIVKQLESNKYNAVYAGSVGRTGEVPACDVVVDVSVPEGTRNLIPRLAAQAMVVGTTGDLPLKELIEYSKKAPVSIYPNFSVGVPLVLHLLQETKKAVPSDWSIEVVEAHHTAKRDAPSGTAKRLLSVLQDAVTPTVPTHSLRLGDTIGEHTVYFAGTGERLEIKHVATQRDVFAIGAVRAAQWTRAQPPALYQK
jgi:2-aminoadipate transaminase